MSEGPAIFSTFSFNGPIQFEGLFAITSIEHPTPHGAPRSFSNPAVTTLYYPLISFPEQQEEEYGEPLTEMDARGCASLDQPGRAGGKNTDSGTGQQRSNDFRPVNATTNQAAPRIGRHCREQGITDTTAATNLGLVNCRSDMVI
jgi:hypothetical protein